MLRLYDGFVKSMFRLTQRGLTGIRDSRYTERVRYYDFEVRISYAETDRMGVIYYANYLVFFERGRTEYLRAHGLRYRDMEENDGIFLPALDSQVTYLHPGRYDDLIRIRTFVSEL